MSALWFLACPAALVVYLAARWFVLVVVFAIAARTAPRERPIRLHTRNGYEWRVDQ